MKKIILSGAGGSVFPYLFSKLENKYEVHVMDSDEKVSLMYKDKNVHIVPKVNDNNFESVIIKIIKDNQIDIYIPLIDEEIVKAIVIGKKLGIKILSPTRTFVELCLDKYKLMNMLRDENISSIETEFANNFTQKFDFPIFLKPNIGRGSRGIQMVSNLNEMEAYFLLAEYNKNEILVQPFIGGEEYTVSVTVNNLNKLIDFIKNKFSEEYVDFILMYLEIYLEHYNYRLINLDSPKGYIVNLEVYNNKSNEIFNLTLDALNKMSFPIKTKYGIQIENFLFLNGDESNTILYNELQESIKDIKHLGFREYISDVIDNIYIDNNEYIIENLNLNHFPELKDYDIIDVTFSKLSKTDYLILQKQ